MSDDPIDIQRDEQRCRLIFDSAIVGMYLSTRGGHCLAANPALARMLGYESGRDLMDDVTDARHQIYLDPAVRDELMRRVDTDGFVDRFECLARRRDRSVVHLWQSVTAIRDENGVMTHVQGIVQDVTSRVRAEAELEAQRTAFTQSEKLADMGALLAGVAHELNNPLSILLGQTQLILREVGEGTLARRAESIAQAAERCVRIVRNFLALARHHAPERQLVSLNAVVQEAVELLAYPLRVDDVEVIFDLSPAVLPIWADPHQLHQAIVNLLTNAHHALRAWPRPRRIRIVTERREGGGVCVCVEDSGPGIPEDVCGRIFEPFFTTKPEGEGTGLGLSLCRGIVEGHGRIEVGTAERLGGAAFIIDLPPGQRAGQAAAGIAVAATNGAARHVLVVDDEVAIGEVVAETLEEDGHAVEIAHGGHEALDRLRAARYDVVLTDIRMPGLDGIGLYHAVQDLPAQRRPIFVFMTGDGLTPRTMEFLSQPGRVHLEKPFRAEQLRAIVQQTYACSSAVAS
jgi:PAS domain S-box-containing protein